MSALTTAAVRLPLADGSTREVTFAAPREWACPTTPFTSRTAYAAAHVIPRVNAANVPGAPADINWDATLGYRHQLWSYGLGVAEAMDTAQRGMGVGWEQAAELIRRSCAEAASVGGAIACGAGTDQLDPASGADLAAITDAYREQVEVISAAGGRVILMASRALAATATGPQHYARVYGDLLREASEPVILHWLGEVFDPALVGYWGTSRVDEATATFLRIIEEHADKVDGVKVSLLDADHERGLRAALPAGVKLYTGDDFNYPELVVGDGEHHSDALLGAFAAIYPAASAALQSLDAGDDAQARQILDDTVELSRALFETPTQYYKTGIAFLSWLNGHQPAFAMVGGLHSGRSTEHLSRVALLADQAGLLLDPELAVQRLRAFLTVQGVAQ